MELLERAVEITKRMAMIVYEFKDDGTSQEQLNGHFREYTHLLQQLSQSDDKTPIPHGLLQFMDSGRHPDGWLKQRLSVLQEENSRAHGRVLALQEFKEQLIDRLKREEEGERGQFTSSLQQQMERKPMTIKLSLPTASNTEDEIIDI